LRFTNRNTWENIEKGRKMELENLEFGKIKLRPLEPEDLEMLYTWENDPLIWEVSNTLVPFSKYMLEQYILDAQQDIYTTKQFRLIIETSEGDAVGAIDLFGFDPLNQRAGIGILIHQPGERRKGYATDALLLMCTYAENVLGLHQLFANITAGNEASLALFQKCGFTLSGCKQDWVKSGKTWKDEFIFQKIFA